MPQDLRNRDFRTPFSDMAGRLYPDGSPPDEQNLEGPNSASAAQTGMASYIMKKGDTLWGVSQATGIPLGDIQTANPHVGDPTRIPVGTTLNLPFGMKSAGNAAPYDMESGHALDSPDVRNIIGNGQSPGQELSRPENPGEMDHHSTSADNQPVDAETAKKYNVDPGTTWRIVHVGQKLGTLWRAVGAGTATREQALSFRDELAQLRAAPDLSSRELQEARVFAGVYSSLANSTGKFTTDEIIGDPLFADHVLGMPSGGGATRLPGAPLGAGVNMLRPGSSPLPGLNQQIGLSLPRSPIPRNLSAPPAKRNP